MGGEGEGIRRCVSQCMLGGEADRWGKEKGECVLVPVLALENHCTLHTRQKGKIVCVLAWWVLWERVKPYHLMEQTGEREQSRGAHAHGTIGQTTKREMRKSLPWLASCVYQERKKKSKRAKPKAWNPRKEAIFWAFLSGRGKHLMPLHEMVQRAS